jgi:hypothetical protein
MEKETRQNSERDLKDPIYKSSKVFAHYVKLVVDKLMIKIILEQNGSLA